MTALWAGLIVASLGAYALKLAGVALPARLLAVPRVQRIASLLPITMLAALVTVELLDAGGRFGVDWRVVVGVAAGGLAVKLRQGVLVVFVVAVAMTAGLRALV